MSGLFVPHWYDCDPNDHQVAIHMHHLWDKVPDLVQSSGAVYSRNPSSNQSPHVALSISRPIYFDVNFFLFLLLCGTLFSLKRPSLLYETVGFSLDLRVVSLGEFYCIWVLFAVEVTRGSWAQLLLWLVTHSLCSWMSQPQALILWLGDWSGTPWLVSEPVALPSYLLHTGKYLANDTVLVLCNLVES